MRRQRNDGTPFARIVAVRRRYVSIEVGSERNVLPPILYPFVESVSAGDRAERVLRGEMAVERPVSETGKSGNFDHAHGIETSFPEQPGCRGNYSPLMFGRFLLGDFQETNVPSRLGCRNHYDRHDTILRGIPQRDQGLVFKK